MKAVMIVGAWGAFGEIGFGGGLLHAKHAVVFP